MAQKLNEATEPRVQLFFVESYRETCMGPKGSAGPGLCVLVRQKGIIYMDWFKKHKVLSTVLGLVLCLFIFALVRSGGSGSSSTPQTQTASEMQVGQEGYLRLPGNSDSNQKICLGTTKDDADQISKALAAKDFLGLLEIPGAFCVGNGSKALLVEKNFPLRKVRITAGVNEVDSDKVGLSGWLPMEWVVAN